MERIITIIITAILLTNCSANWHLKRAIKKNPLLLQKDTLVINDTILTKEVSKDTLIHLNTLYDTLRIEKENLRVKLIRVNDSIYIRGECLTDTIYRSIEVPIEKIVYKPQKSLLERLKDLPILIVLCIIIYLIARNYLIK